MREWLGKFMYGMFEVWRSIGIPQKVSIILIMFLTVTALGTVMYLGSRPDHVVLYSSMSNETAQKVIELVESQGIDFRSRDSGRTILVPRQHVSILKARIRAAGVEIDQDGPKGWKLFDSNELGMSQEQLRIKKNRALKGELERMLGVMPGVSKAHVELATPPRRAFYRKGTSQRGSAAVLLTMRPGRMLTPAQVSTIRHQVAAGVPNLMPEDVTISDNYGRLLARRRSPGGIGGDPDSQLELKEQIEYQLQEKAEAILRPFVGPNAVIAMVSAEVDFDKVETLREDYDSANKTTIMEKITTEENSKIDTSGDTQGTASVAVATATPTQSNQQDSTTENTKTTESNFVVPKITERKNHQGARIIKLSVAVSIRRAGDTAMTEATLEKYRKLVVSAVGADITAEGRGDNVEVLEEVAAPLVEVTSATPLLETLTEGLQKVLESPLLRIVFGLILMAVVYRVFRNQFTSADIAQADVQSGIYGEDLFLPNPSRQVKDLDSEEEPTTPYDFVTEQSAQDPALLAQAIETWLRREEG